MAVDGFVNETELRKAIEQLHPDGELFEVRLISSDKRRKPAMSASLHPHLYPLLFSHLQLQD